MEGIIGVVGAGGFAREVADIAYELGYSPVLIYKNKSTTNFIPDYRYVYEKDYFLVNSKVTIGIGENHLRSNIVSAFESKIDFVNLIHPNVTFGKMQRIDSNHSKGLILCSGVRITNNVKFGSHIIVNLNATIGHDVVIDDFVNISPGCNISGNVHLERFSYVGTGASIIQGTEKKSLKIGENTVIGAGAVVINDCEPNSVYVGIPAKRIK